MKQETYSSIRCFAPAQGRGFLSFALLPLLLLLP